MFNYTTLAACFTGLLGFRQSRPQDLAPLSDNLLASSSGRYYQDFHPLLTLENITAVAPRFTEYPPEYTLSVWLQEKIQASLQAIMSALLEKYKLERAGKTLLQSLKLYEGAGMYTDKIIRQDRFVGFELTLPSYQDLEILLNGIGLQLDTVNPSFKLYLYSDTELKQTITLNANVKGVFGWYDLPQAETLPGGTYYLVYNEAELQGQAINRKDDLSKAPCSSCSAYNPAAYKLWNEYLTLKPVSFTGNPMGNTPTYVNNTNWGLNLQIAVQCSLSSLVCSQKPLFADALGKQFAVDLIKLMKYSTRNNALANTQLSGMAIDALPGMEAELKAALQALQIDLTNFDSRCLPCAPQRKITYKTI